MTFWKMLCPAVATLAAALAVALTGGPALGQEAYPTAKPVSMVVAFPTVEMYLKAAFGSNGSFL